MPAPSPSKPCGWCWTRTVVADPDVVSITCHMARKDVHRAENRGLGAQRPWLGRWSGEDCVQDDGVGHASRQVERALAERDHEDRDAVDTLGGASQIREVAGRAVMIDDGFTAPQRPEQVDGVLEPRRRHARQTHEIEQHVEAAAEPGGVPAAAQPVQGGRHRRCDEGMAGVRIGRRGADPESAARRDRRAGQHCRVLGVEPFRQEDRTETDAFGDGDFVEQRPRVVGVPGEAVEPEFRTVRLRCGPTGDAHERAAAFRRCSTLPTALSSFEPSGQPT